MLGSGRDGAGALSKFPSQRHQPGRGCCLHRLGLTLLHIFLHGCFIFVLITRAEQCLRGSVCLPSSNTNTRALDCLTVTSLPLAVSPSHTITPPTAGRSEPRPLPLPLRRRLLTMTTMMMKKQAGAPDAAWTRRRCSVSVRRQQKSQPQRQTRSRVLPLDGAVHTAALWFSSCCVALASSFADAVLLCLPSS